MDLNVHKMERQKWKKMIPVLKRLLWHSGGKESSSGLHNHKTNGRRLRGRGIRCTLRSRNNYQSCPAVGKEVHPMFVEQECRTRHRTSVCMLENTWSLESPSR
jgi:hypothetical protein